MEIINSASDCNVNKYLACKFNQKYHVLLNDYKGRGEDIDTDTLERLINAFEIIETEFLDACQVTVQEINLMRVAQAAQCRYDAIQNYLLVCFESIKAFDEPYFPAIQKLEKHKYVLIWDGNKDNFIKSLRRIEKSEVKHLIALRNHQKALDDYRNLQETNPTANEHSGNARRDFISMINYIQKAGWVINFETTSLEQLGIAWHDFSEQQKALMEQAERGRR